MGLSNGERYSKILWSVKNIEDQLKEVEDRKNISAFSGKLWSALLNKESNSGFWIMGGGFDSERFNEGTFLCEALSVHIERMNNKNDEFRKRLEEKDPLVESIRIQNIIGDKNAPLVLIYQWIENFYYAVNRYDDEFSESLPELKSRIANLKGELFSVFSDDEVFAKAYLLNQILDKCVDKYDIDCPLAIMLEEHYLYHGFKLSRNHSLEDLALTWKAIQFEKEIPLEKRALITLCVLGGRVGEAHNRRKVEKSLDGHVNPNRLAEVLDWCKEQNEKNKADNEYRPYDFCALTYSIE